MVKVSKAGDVAEVVSNKENLLIVVVYETAFDLLDDKAKAMLIRMELDKVVYDFEKDKVSLSAPMISITLGSYQRYGNVATQHAELAIHTIQQLEEMEKQRKEEEKAEKSTIKKRH